MEKYYNIVYRYIININGDFGDKKDGYDFEDEFNEPDFESALSIFNGVVADVIKDGYGSEYDGFGIELYEEEVGKDKHRNLIREFICRKYPISEEE